MTWAFTTGETFPAAFEAALAELEIGQVSAPVETDAGTHFIKLLDRQKESFELADRVSSYRAGIVARSRQRFYW